MQRQASSVRWLYQRSVPRWSQLLVALLGLVFALQPWLALTAQVAQIKVPKASKRAPLAYNEPDGLFHLEYPAAFSTPAALTFADTLATPLAGLQVADAALTPDGALLVTAGSQLTFFDAGTGEQLTTWSLETPGRAVGFSPDGQFLWLIDEADVLHLDGLAEGNG